MKAVWLDRHGGPEVLALSDRPVPECEPWEVLVEVKACGLNHLDIWVRKGGGRGFPIPLILGSDAVGIVVDAPEDSNIAIGDEVVIYPAEGCLTCPACQRGDEQLCAKFKIYGAWRDGGLAERMAFPLRNCILKPKNLAWTQAAAVGINYITAWHMLVARAQVKPGEKILIQAAGSGVSTAALQIARFLGAHVLATSSTQSKLDHAEQCGAEVVVNYKTGDVAASVLEWTKGLGVDVVVDHVGAPNWETDLKCLAKGGRLVFCGTTGGPEVKLNLAHTYFKGQSILGSTMGRRDELATILDLMGRGYFLPVVDRVFPMAEIAEAHTYLESGSQTGKVVIKVAI
ncbi:MAG TPA: zinc-binding dehydrogenase [Planctomycetota bacterium]|nr:zinc-binding dehydrogenase [Planctomycetota bacterium]